MKKLLFRFLAIFMVMCLSLGFIACKDGDDADTDVETEVAGPEYTVDSGIDKDSEPFSVVSNGTSNYTIVIPQNASTVIEKVAAEFSSYFMQVSGVGLQVAVDNSSVTQNFISLGNTEKLTSANLSGASIKDDGYVVKTVDQNIYIYGSQDLGVQNGVYCFIERFMGVRWLSEKSTYLPKSETVNVYPCDIKEEPIFTYRYWYSSAPRFNEDYYKHKMFNNGKANLYSPVDSDHNITDYEDRRAIGWVNKYDVVDADGNWLPGVEKTDSNYYLKDIHPEYFTNMSGIDINGNEKPAKPSSSGGYDICYSCGVNADGSLRDGDSTARYVIDKAKRALIEDATEKKIKQMHIGQMDLRGAICQCQTCQARIEQIRYSGIIVMFINAIEKEVNTWLEQEQDRTITFTTFAYHESENPPVKQNENGEYEPLSPAVVVSDNIWIKIAPIDADYSYGFTDERQTEFYQNIFAGWKTVADNFILWDYNVCFFRFYFFYPNRAYMKSNLTMYKELGVHQVFQEAGAPNQRERWQNLLSMYIATKLYWNLDWSVDQLEDEFIRLFYGEGYEYARAVIKNFENYFEILRNERPIEIKVASGATIYLKADLYDIRFLTAQMEIIDKGINALIQNTELSEARKQELILNLKELKLTPMSMIYENYTSYYHTSGYEAFALEYLDILDQLGLQSLGYIKVADLRAKHGLA